MSLMMTTMNREMMMRIQMKMMIKVLKVAAVHLAAEVPQGDPDVDVHGCQSDPRGRRDAGADKLLALPGVDESDGGQQCGGGAPQL